MPSLVATSVDSLVRDLLAPRLKSRSAALRSLFDARTRPAPSVGVPPSPWTADRRHSIIGTALDYLVGYVWAGAAIDGAIARATQACRRARQITWILPELSAILACGPARRGRDGALRRHRDFFRATLLLAELDAMLRAGLPPPRWTLDVILGDHSLSWHLRRNYPVEVVSELHALLAVARSDLPRGESIQYNPVLGLDTPEARIGADADLLVDDLLIELKVSNEKFDTRWALQLFAYAALATRSRDLRVARGGIYNPRWRRLSIVTTLELAQALGFASPQESVAWFFAGGP